MLSHDQVFFRQGFKLFSLDIKNTTSLVNNLIKLLAHTRMLEVKVIRFLLLKTAKLLNAWIFAV